MWRGDEYGLSSPELTMVYESCIISVMVGGFYGAYVESAKAGKMFIEKNKYEMFKHPREAQSSLQDRMMISYMKVRKGYRYFLFFLPTKLIFKKCK